MHAALIICVIVLVLGLALAGLKIRHLIVGQDSICEQLDELKNQIEQPEVAALAITVKELSDAQSSDVRDIGKRITELSDRIELMRRKSATRGGGGGFESMRSRAEAGAARNQEMSRPELLALAEGK